MIAAAGHLVAVKKQLTCPCQESCFLQLGFFHAAPTSWRAAEQCTAHQHQPSPCCWTSLSEGDKRQCSSGRSWTFGGINNINGLLIEQAPPLLDCFWVRDISLGWITTTELSPNGGTPKRRYLSAHPYSEQPLLFL